MIDVRWMERSLEHENGVRVRSLDDAFAEVAKLKDNDEVVWISIEGGGGAYQYWRALSGIFTEALGSQHHLLDPLLLDPAAGRLLWHTVIRSIRAAKTHEVMLAEKAALLEELQALTKQQLEAAQALSKTQADVIERLHQTLEEISGSPSCRLNPFALRPS